MTIGIAAVTGSSRKRWTTAKPSTSGISRSTITRPGSSRWGRGRSLGSPGRLQHRVARGPQDRLDQFQGDGIIVDGQHAPGLERRRAGHRYPLQRREQGIALHGLDQVIQPPSANPLPRSSSIDTMTTGIVAIDGSALARARKSQPSTRGNRMSRTMALGCSSRASASPALTVPRDRNAVSITLQVQREQVDGVRMSSTIRTECASRSLSCWDRAARRGPSQPWSAPMPWDAQREGAPNTHLAVDPELPAVQLHKPARQSQPEARAFRRPAGCAACLLKFLENAASWSAGAMPMPVSRTANQHGIVNAGEPRHPRARDRA